MGVAMEDGSIKRGSRKKPENFIVVGVERWSKC
jgi:hypothetical protein